MFARGNLWPIGKIDDCIKDALLVHHLRILNWLVVNSPGAIYKGLPRIRIYAEVLTVILKYRRTECDTMR